MTQIHRSELRNMQHFEIHSLYTSCVLRVAPSDVTSVFTLRAGVQFVKFLVRYFYCNISASNTVCRRQRSPKKYVKLYLDRSVARVGWSMWDLCETELHWDSFISEYICFPPVSIIPIMVRTSGGSWDFVRVRQGLRLLWD